MQKWEYFLLTGRMTKDNMIEKLNTYGKEGWELVNTVYANANYIDTYHFFLKRPIN